MIETKVPMDVRSYKAKLIGPFTTRQLVCVVIAVLIDAVLFFAILHPFNVPAKPAIFALVFVDVPIVAFTLEPMGMPMEQYLRSVLIRSFIAPTKRKAKSSLPKSQPTFYTKKERKVSQKRMKNLLKTNPELKAYK